MSKNMLDCMWEGDLHQALGTMAPDGFWQDESYLAACPLHSDQDYSFRYLKSKRTWICESGCGGGDLVALGVRLWRCGIDAAAAKVLAFCGEDCHQVARRYPYLDAQGQFLFEVLRFSPKCFDTRTPTGWTWNDLVKGKPRLEQRVLYRLPEVIVAADVFIVEGEKDCETARDMGLVATCNPGGSSRWRPEYVQFFYGKRVRIIADADESGRKHGRQIAGSLMPVAESVQLIEFAEVKDLTEWIQAGGTVEDLLAIFDSVPTLGAEDVEGWWDPVSTIRLQCEAGFLLEPLPVLDPPELQIEVEPIAEQSLLENR